LQAQLAVTRHDKPGPNFRNLEEFLVHGIKYAFRAVPGEMTRGMPTAASALPLAAALHRNPQEPPLVWPDPQGETRGVSIEPLYRQAPTAAREDQEFHALLTIVDTIRMARARETGVAIKELQDRLKKHAATHG
jgi:hypothetical protein